MNRRSAILASLAGTALWAQAFDSKYSYGATPQKDDEDGYQESPEAGKQAEEREKDIWPLGTSAPAWLRNAEVYSGWYDEFSDEDLHNGLKDFPLIIGAPHSRDSADRLHRFGIRTIPYISFYKGLDLEVAEKLGVAKGAGEFNELQSPFWRELDLGKHPEWKLCDKDGRTRRPFAEPNYPPAWSEVCTAVPGFAQAALRGVQGLLKLGLDGLFIDNVHPTPHCYGPVFGKHTHVNGLDNAQAYRQLLGSVYALVKQWLSENVVALNPGHVEPVYWPSADAIMYESYICTNPEQGYACAKDWDAVLQKAKNCQEAIRDGKVVLANSYFVPPLFYVRNPARHTAFTQPPAKDDVFYSYACARLSGFLWSGFFTLPPKHPAQVLYKIRIGKPLAGFDEVDGAYVRRFEQGVVVVNPLEEAKHVQIKAGGLSRLNDVLNKRCLV